MKENRKLKVGIDNRAQTDAIAIAPSPMPNVVLTWTMKSARSSICCYEHHYNISETDATVLQRRPSVRYVIIISLNSALYSDQIFAGFGKYTTM